MATAHQMRSRLLAPQQQFAVESKQAQMEPLISVRGEGAAVLSWITLVWNLALASQRRLNTLRPNEYSFITNRKMIKNIIF
jgi:hypothetical protein